MTGMEAREICHLLLFACLLYSLRFVCSQLTERDPADRREAVASSDVAGVLDGKNNEDLEQTLQTLPSDKLKNLLKYINKHGESEEQHDSEVENSSNGNIDNEAKSRGSEVENSSNGNIDNEAESTARLRVEARNPDHMKSTFHRLRNDDVATDSVKTGRGNSQTDEDKQTEKYIKNSGTEEGHIKNSDTEEEHNKIAGTEEGHNKITGTEEGHIKNADIEEEHNKIAGTEEGHIKNADTEEEHNKIAGTEEGHIKKISTEEEHLRKMVSGSTRTVDDVEPGTSVLIHAFEGEKDEEQNEDSDSLHSDLRGMSRDENQVKQQKTRRPLSKETEDESAVKADLFAGAEDKPSANQTASNRMTFSHPALYRIIQQTDAARQKSNNEDSSHESTHNDLTTFVSPISLKPIHSRSDQQLRYRKIIKEKLPAKIMQQIDAAMIQKVRESGDRRASFDVTEPRLESPTESFTRPDSSELDVQLVEDNIAQSDPSKREGKEGKAQFAFSYDPESPVGPEMWKVLHTDWTCQGRKQSPINILTDSIKNDTVCKNVIIRIEPEGRPISGILRNNGHAPTFSLANSATVRLIGGKLPNDYFLKQLHFHFGCDASRGSEHQLDGQSYPLELHLVFWDKNTFETFGQAAKSDRGIAVVAILFQRAFVPPGEMKNTPFAQMVQVVRKIPNEGDFVRITEIFDFRLEKLVPNAINSRQADRFYTYEGSLSTPGCYESVTWFVYDTHPVVTDDQLESLRRLKSTKVNSDGTMCDNFRPIQKSFGRRIYSNII